MQVKAVIDRFEGDRAVLLIGEGETAVNWPRQLLPDATEGDVLTVTINVDAAATRQAREEAASLLNAMCNRNSGADSGQASS